MIGGEVAWGVCVLVGIFVLLMCGVLDVFLSGLRLGGNFWGDWEGDYVACGFLRRWEFEVQILVDDK